MYVGPLNFIVLTSYTDDIFFIFDILVTTVNNMLIALALYTQAHGFHLCPPSKHPELLTRYLSIFLVVTVNTLSPLVNNVALLTLWACGIRGSRYPYWSIRKYQTHFMIELFHVSYMYSVSTHIIHIFILAISLQLICYTQRKDFLGKMWRLFIWLFILYFITLAFIAEAEVTECERQVREAEGKGLLGGPTPDCDENGKFMLEQCHGSSGYCWCVDIETGLELLDTKRGPTEERVDCEGMILLEMALVCLYSLIANANKNRLLFEQTKPKMEGHGWLPLPPPPSLIYSMQLSCVYYEFVSFTIFEKAISSHESTVDCRPVYGLKWDYFLVHKTLMWLANIAKFGTFYFAPPPKKKEIYIFGICCSWSCT